MQLIFTELTPMRIHLSDVPIRSLDCKLWPERKIGKFLYLWRFDRDFFHREKAGKQLTNKYDDGHFEGAHSFCQKIIRNSLFLNFFT